MSPRSRPAPSAGGARLRHAVWDLVTGTTCVGCGTAGQAWCPDCDRRLPREARPVVPQPCPPGLVGLWSVAEYADPVRPLLVQHKEQRRVALARPLGGLLALAVAAALRSEAGAPVLLVPVPSGHVRDRHRGYAPTHALARVAARRLRTAGQPARVAPLLRVRAPVQDQAGLDAGARADNLAGSLWCPAHLLARQRRRTPTAVAVVCDDVVTTGATAREAQRALAAAGLPAHAVATVAATRRRTPTSSPGVLPQRPVTH